MNIIQSMIHEKLGEVRIIRSEDGNPMNTLFCAVDVVRSLGYPKNNSSNVISRHCSDILKIPIPDSIGRNQIINFIPLPELINLIQKTSNTSIEIKEELIDWFIGIGIIPNYIIPIPISTRDESLFIDSLEDSLEGFGIPKGIKQYQVGNYRIDYYIPNLNIAIEFDENNHKSYTYEQQELRELIISKELGCKFIRVSDSNSVEYNIGYVLNNIILSIMNITLKQYTKHLCNKIGNETEQLDMIIPASIIAL